MTNATPLMVAAISEDETVATSAWQQWRGSTDLHSASWQELQILPLIPRTRFTSLVADDLEADRLNGIVRRAWTESQLHLAIIREVVDCIRSAGCLAAVFGDAGMHLRSTRQSSTRPIGDLRVLVARADLNKAASALQATGWRLHDAIPDADTLNWQTHIALKRDTTFLHLHWRALDVPMQVAAACEREFVSALQSSSTQEDSLHILAPGHELLVALASCSTPPTGGRYLPQLDAAFLVPHINHWNRWAALAAKFSPSALQSIIELRALGIAIPDLPAPKPPSVFLQRLTNAARWRSRRIRRKLLQLLKHSEGIQ